MSKWKCEICHSEFENYQAQGFDGVIYCPLCYFKELYKREKQENQQLKKQKADVAQYIKTHDLFDRNYDDKKAKNDLLRMLGEIDE